MAFEGVAFEHLVHYWKPRAGGDQADDDLRLHRLVVLGETRFLIG
jgi:hypothetical protein